MLLRLPAILLLVLAACEPWDGDPTVTLDTHPAPAGVSPPSAAVESGEEPLRVRGVIALPDRCRALTADLTRHESDLRLWITHEPVQEECPPGEVRLAYTAEIQGLRPGRYNLRVVHGRSGVWRGTEPVLVHPVVVPRS